MQASLTFCRHLIAHLVQSIIFHTLSYSLCGKVMQIRPQGNCEMTEITVGRFWEVSELCKWLTAPYLFVHMQYIDLNVPPQLFLLQLRCNWACIRGTEFDGAFSASGRWSHDVMFEFARDRRQFTVKRFNVGSRTSRMTKLWKNRVD